MGNTKLIGFHPGARLTDPETSHEALDDKDHSGTQTQILQDVKVNGPGTEETILNRMGVTQRSNASSQISSLVQGHHLVNLIDPRTTKNIKLRNTSGARALVRGLPAHQKNDEIIESLLVRMDRENEEPHVARRKPPLNTADAEKAIGLTTERRRGERRQRDRRKTGLISAKK